MYIAFPLLTVLTVCSRSRTRNAETGPEQSEITNLSFTVNEQLQHAEHGAK